MGDSSNNSEAVGYKEASKSLISLLILKKGVRFLCSLKKLREIEIKTSLWAKSMIVTVKARGRTTREVRSKLPNQAVYNHFSNLL